MVQIRFFEETVLENFQKGVFSGTTHTYLGQEANAVAILSFIEEEDIVFSNHRCHGHFLAYDGDPHALFAELMGKATGVCGGRGGSQHLHWRNFYSNGVQGGIVPIATGMALSEKIKNNRAVTIVFLGDGTLGEGVVYEALNMAALRNAPILYVIENNRIAQTTPAEKAIAGNVLVRFAGFGILGLEVDSSNILDIAPQAEQLISDIRDGRGPHVLLLHTCRFGPHSKGDDTRSEFEIDHFRTLRDPIKILAEHLAAAKRAEIEAAVAQEIADAFQAALRDPFADPSSLHLNT
jgi:TPP-dependent pyruvate/acetoin dehydrogenase alpha subunit